MTSELILDPGNPYDFEAGELAELAAQLSDATGEFVRVAERDEPGYGVSFYEVLHVWVPWDSLEGPAIRLMLDLLVEWAKHRVKRSPKRKRSIIIHGPNGEVLKSVEVDIDESVEDSTAQNQEMTGARTRPE